MIFLDMKIDEVIFISMYLLIYAILMPISQNINGNVHRQSLQRSDLVLVLGFLATTLLGIRFVSSRRFSPC